MNHTSTSAAHSTQSTTLEWQGRPQQRGRSRPVPRASARRESEDAALASALAANEPVGGGLDVPSCLDSAGASIRHYASGAAIFYQGEAGAEVRYVRRGLVKLSVASASGRDAVVAILGPDNFFGESCLAGQQWWKGRADALADSVIMAIPRHSLPPLLHTQPAFAVRFLHHLVARGIRMEEDLLDQLLHSSERRLARTLLLLARGHGPDHVSRVVPRLSQETLADMVGTTRSRVNFFLNKFKKLGYIEYQGDRPMTVHRSLTSVLQD